MILKSVLDGNVCPGISFHEMPKDTSTLEPIEEMFFVEGIAVAWDDESHENCGKRNHLIPPRRLHPHTKRAAIHRKKGLCALCGVDFIAILIAKSAFGVFRQRRWLSELASVN